MNTLVQKSLEGTLLLLCPLRAGVRCAGDHSMWIVNIICFSSKKPMPMLYCFKQLHQVINAKLHVEILH